MPFETERRGSPSRTDAPPQRTGDALEELSALSGWSLGSRVPAVGQLR